VNRAERTALAAAVLLVVDLTFLPWHGPPPGTGRLGRAIDANRTAVQDPGSALGIAAAAVAAAVVVVVAAAVWRGRPLGRPLPAWAAVAGSLGVLALLAAKLARYPEGVEYGAWTGVVLAAALVAATVLAAVSGRRPSAATVAVTGPD
jgi:hypothetical protein